MVSPDNPSQDKDFQALLTRLEKLEATVHHSASIHEGSTKELRDELKRFRDDLDRFRGDLDRFTQASRETTANVQERFKLVDQRITLIQDDINGMRQKDLVRLSDDIKRLSSDVQKDLVRLSSDVLKSLSDELSGSTSPLATKAELNTLSNKTSELSGKVEAHFKINLYTTVSSVIVLLASIIGLYFMVGKLDSGRSASQSAPALTKLSH